jgi:hypothetical protein
VKIVCRLLEKIGPIFKDSEIQFFLNFLTLKDGTDTFSRNVGITRTTRR